MRKMFWGLLFVVLSFVTVLFIMNRFLGVEFSDNFTHLSYSITSKLGLNDSVSMEAGDTFNPVAKGVYECKGTQSNPMSLTASDYDIINEMLKSAHNGNTSFFFRTDGLAMATIGRRMNESCAMFISAIKAIDPVMPTICRYRYEYDSLSGLVMLSLLDIHDTSVGVKEGYEDYKKLCKYVASDVKRLKSEGVLSDSMTDKEKSLAVSKYIAQNTKYDEKIAKALSGPFRLGTTASSPAHNALGFYEGWDLVCDGYSGLYNAFMWELGIESYIVVSVNHAWNIAKLDGKWCHTDVTYSDPITYDRGGNIGATLTFQEEYINTTYIGLRGLDSRSLTSDSLYFLETFLGITY